MSLRALVFKEGDWWSAQCLEYDIATQAKSYEALLLEIERVITAHFAIAAALGLQPFEHLGPAPDVFFHLCEKVSR